MKLDGNISIFWRSMKHIRNKEPSSSGFRKGTKILGSFTSMPQPKKIITSYNESKVMMVNGKKHSDEMQGVIVKYFTDLL